MEIAGEGEVRRTGKHQAGLAPFTARDFGRASSPGELGDAAGPSAAAGHQVRAQRVAGYSRRSRKGLDRAWAPENSRRSVSAQLGACLLSAGLTSRGCRKGIHA